MNKTTTTHDEQFLSQFKFGVIRFNEWKQRYQVWLESDEFRTGKDWAKFEGCKSREGAEFLAQDVIDVLWFSTVQEAEQFCQKFGFEPVTTKTIHHTSGQVLWM